MANQMFLSRTVQDSGATSCARSKKRKPLYCFVDKPIRLSFLHVFSRKSVMKRIVLCLAVFLCLSSTGAFAGNDVRRTYKGFQLFTNCEPMRLLMEGFNKHSSKIGLTFKPIRNAAESRLRAAELYTPKLLGTDSFLYININVVQQAFGISLEFWKKVRDEYSGQIYSTITWRVMRTGLHGNDPSYIVNAVSQSLDEFLAEFLRVNEKACKNKK